MQKDIQYVGVNDRNIDLFEGMYKIPEGMAYNSYVIIDEKIAVMDTVEDGPIILSYNIWSLTIPRIYARLLRNIQTQKSWLPPRRL